MMRFWVGIIVGLGMMSVHAKGGDGIRENAPVTALLLDLKAQHLPPLEKAYFENEIDYFLDYEGASLGVTRDLYFLRSASRAIGEGDISEARDVLRQIQKYPVHRKYLEGVALALEGKYPQSLEQFRQIIDQRKGLSKQLISLSFMGAARIFHEVADYSQAIYHYHQVRQYEPAQFQAVFEKSWSFYLDGDMNGALGATLSFLSPYFNHTFYPEAFIVRAAAFYQLCHFDRANETVELLKKEYEPIQRELQSLMAKGDSWLFDASQTSSVHPRILGALIQDTKFRAGQRAYIALSTEADKLGGSNKSVATKARDQMRQRLSVEARRVLQKSAQELQSVLGQADLIQIEVLQSGANQLLGKNVKSGTDPKIIDLGAMEFHELIQFWPFEKEFWADEIGSYYYGLQAQCGINP